MLKDELALYSKLTGKDGLNVPVGIIGAYLDGYERVRRMYSQNRIGFRAVNNCRKNRGCILLQN